VTRRYSDRGFAYAQVDPKTRTDEAAKSVDVTFDVVRGPLEFVRHVDVSGNTRTVDRVVRREVQLVEGQLYSRVRSGTRRRASTRSASSRK